MKTISHCITCLLPLAVSLCTSSLTRAQDTPPPTDPGWPREFTAESKKLTIYQPQIDEWKDHSTMYFRCAIEIEGVMKEPKFGVAEIEARTLVDQTTRTVKVFSTKREVRFTGVSPEEEKSLRDAVDAIRPPEQLITTGNGWKPVETPKPKAATPTQRPTVQPTSRQSLDTMSQSRSRGTTQTQRT